jgi:hypothetical protein
MRVGSEKNFTGASMSLLGKGSVANAGVLRAILAFEVSLGGIKDPVTVGVIDHIVEIGKLLFADEIPQDIDVPVGL